MPRPRSQGFMWRVRTSRRRTVRAERTRRVGAAARMWTSFARWQEAAQRQGAAGDAFAGVAGGAAIYREACREGVTVSIGHTKATGSRFKTR